ncbi:hypothetical protein ACMT1E_04450 [Sphingomonas flavalba]|uniref:hypothetical protein n=1 Tax=Sphingomonas flavalba TaxID=2559804 RepID=UPI0039E16F18
MSVTKKPARDTITSLRGKLAEAHSHNNYLLDRLAAERERADVLDCRLGIYASMLDRSGMPALAVDISRLLSLDAGTSRASASSDITADEVPF